MDMSTSYQIVFGDKTQDRDPEANLRFYKPRNLSAAPQSPWLYEIFKESMNSRVQAMGVLGICFIPLSAVYYDFVI